MTEIASPATGLDRVCRALLHFSGGLLLRVPAFAVAVAGVGALAVRVGLPPSVMITCG